MLDSKTKILLNFSGVFVIEITAKVKLPISKSNILHNNFYFYLFVIQVKMAMEYSKGWFHVLNAWN